MPHELLIPVHKLLSLGWERTSHQVHVFSLRTNTQQARTVLANGKRNQDPRNALAGLCSKGLSLYVTVSFPLFQPLKMY